MTRRPLRKNVNQAVTPDTPSATHEIAKLSQTDIGVLLRATQHEETEIGPFIKVGRQVPGTPELPASPLAMWVAVRTLHA